MTGTAHVEELPRPEDADQRRFHPAADGARSTRAQFIDMHGRTYGHYRIPWAIPPHYVQDGVLVFALGACAPHPTTGETEAVYRETWIYPLSQATRISGD